MGHTPGPWVVGGASGNEGEAREIVAASRTIAWSASTWDEDEGDVVTEEDDANAHLIAAAPELLAVCREMAEIIHAMSEGGVGLAAGAAAPYMAVIRRAEGRE